MNAISPRLVGHLGVFSSPHAGRNPLFASRAVALGRAMAAANVGLVVAGKAQGMTGSLVTAVREAGGHVTGLAASAPDGTREATDAEFHESHSAHGLQERKRRFYDLCDGFAALPGGFGVLDPVCEHLTWRQRESRVKPLFIFDVEGYWRPLLEMFDDMRRQSFLPGTFAAGYAVTDDPVELVRAFSQYLLERPVS